MSPLWFALFVVLNEAELITRWELNYDLPMGTNGSITGYDVDDDSVWIINPQTKTNGIDVMQFSLDTNTFSVESHSTSSTDQDYLKHVDDNAFVTIGDIIYFVDYHPYNHAQCNGGSSSTLLSTSCRAFIRCFSMKTGDFIDNEQHCNLDLHVDTSHGYYNTPPCLAQKDNEYLMVFGGQYYEQNPDTLAVSSYDSQAFWYYDLKYNSWYQGPSLNHGISNDGCIVASDDYLYAIGGVYDGQLNTQIERIDVSHMSNLNAGGNGWKPLKASNALDSANEYVSIYKNAPQNPVVVELENVIYVVSGGNDANTPQEKCSNIVYYIDISGGGGGVVVDNTIPLKYNACGASGVMADGDIYVFGGYYYDYQKQENIYEMVWQKSSFDPPTVSPTGEPTKSPTDKPTLSPTDNPTKSPTDKPTNAPTDEPTESPTDKPTNAPTDEPTKSPTDEPTESPTDHPTNDPTDVPTESPTDKPTSVPTDGPTKAPFTTAAPTKAPITTKAPTSDPTRNPTVRTTERTTERPTLSPTDRPTVSPTDRPTAEPTDQPTEQPTSVDEPKLKSSESSPKDWIILGCSLGAVAIMIGVGAGLVYKRRLKASRASSNADMLSQEINH